MGRFSITKKRVALGSGIAAVAASGVVAYAYFTATGSGTGAGSVGSATNIAISQAAPISADYSAYDGTHSATAALFPGTTQTVHITVTNNGSGQQYVGSVSLGGWTSTPTGCDSADTGQSTWFSMTPIAFNEELAPGGSDTKVGTITFNDDTANPQDACQGVSLTFSYSSN